MIERVVVPVDFSAESERTLTVATGLARRAAAWWEPVLAAT